MIKKVIIGDSFTCKDFLLILNSSNISVVCTACDIYASWERLSRFGVLNPLDDTHDDVYDTSLKLLNSNSFSLFEDTDIKKENIGNHYIDPLEVLRLTGVYDSDIIVISNIITDGSVHQSVKEYAWGTLLGAIHEDLEENLKNHLYPILTCAIKQKPLNVPAKDIIGALSSVTSINKARTILLDLALNHKEYQWSVSSIHHLLNHFNLSPDHTNYLKIKANKWKNKVENSSFYSNYLLLDSLDILKIDFDETNMGLGFELIKEL